MVQKDDGRLGEAIDQLCDGLQSHQHFFRHIRDGGGRVEFYVGWFSIGNTSDIFTCALMQKLHTLGIDLLLDIYGKDQILQGEDFS